MTLLIRKVYIRCLGQANAFSSKCLFPVRRKASSISVDDGPLLVEASRISVLEFSEHDIIRRKKTEATGDVRALLREYGFTDAHISKLENKIRTFWSLRERIVSPKLKFLQSIGLPNIPKFVLLNPYFLTTSLEKKVIPCYNYLKNFPIPKEQLNLMLKFRPHTLTMNLEKTIAPNVELLRGMGVPLHIIAFYMTYPHLRLTSSHERFKSSIDQAMKMGLDPSTRIFMLAVSVLSGMSEQTWALKIEVYREFGLSDDEIMSAFRKKPDIMTLSAEKIKKHVKFFVNEFGWTPAYILQHSVLLHYDLEKRLIPRCRVMEILREKGVLTISAVGLLKLSEKEFLSRYISGHKEDFPELMDIYIGGRSSQSITSE